MLLWNKGLHETSGKMFTISEPKSALFLLPVCLHVDIHMIYCVQDEWRDNMHEVKFKTWDKKNNRWSYDNLYIDDEGNLYEIEERSQSYETYMYKKRVSEHYEVVWFTGLHDKSGKEIYEGEILKSTTGQIGRVDWRNDTLTYVVSWFAYSSSMGSYESYLYAVASSSTSIGTIYENPELLEADQ